MLNTRIKSINKLISPNELKNSFPINNQINNFISNVKQNIDDILDRKSNKLIVIVGPCSIHDYSSALEYAKFLKIQRDKYSDKLELVMRTYFSKPRTNIGWKGYIYDPDLNGSCDISKGLTNARKLLIEINNMGVPCCMEHVDTIIPQYFDDLICWSAIGARTSESQIHRELSSGISCAVGFKNGTSGDINIAINAIKCSNKSQIFLGCDNYGNISKIETCGNNKCHIILRGGKIPNYTEEDVIKTTDRMINLGITPNIMIDFSHGNSQKIHKNQLKVCENVVNQLHNKNIIGVMIESNLIEGNQDINSKNLIYGKSITDACINLDDTVYILNLLYENKFI